MFIKPIYALKAGGFFTLSGWNYPGYQTLSKQLGKFNQTLSLLMLQDHPWPAFLFGFFTLALPCGQTLIVFSACALSGDVGTGFLNGLAFALLTSPSLFLTMKAHEFIRRAKTYYQAVIGISAIAVGGLALLRGFAEMGVISHLVLNPTSLSYFHIVIY